MELYGCIWNEYLKFDFGNALNLQNILSNITKQLPTNVVYTKLVNSKLVLFFERLRNRNAQTLQKYNTHSKLHNILDVINYFACIEIKMYLHTIHISLFSIFKVESLIIYPSSK